MADGEDISKLLTADVVDGQHDEAHFPLRDQFWDGPAVAQHLQTLGPHAQLRRVVVHEAHQFILVPHGGCLKSPGQELASFPSSNDEHADALVAAHHSLHTPQETRQQPPLVSQHNEQGQAEEPAHDHHTERQRTSVREQQFRSGQDYRADQDRRDDGQHLLHAGVSPQAGIEAESVVHDAVQQHHQGDGLEEPSQVLVRHRAFEAQQEGEEEGSEDSQRVQGEEREQAPDGTRYSLTHG